MIKTVLNAVLVVAILVMGFLLCKSIIKPIDFKDAKEKRQTAVIKKLVDIRKAQECFKDNYGHYTADFDSAVSKPADPVMEGHTFGGWYTDIGLATPVTWEGLNRKEGLGDGLQEQRRRCCKIWY